MNCAGVVCSSTTGPVSRTSGEGPSDKPVKSIQRARKTKSKIGEQKNKDRVFFDLQFRRRAGVQWMSIVCRQIWTDLTSAFARLFILAPNCGSERSRTDEIHPLYSIVWVVRRHVQTLFSYENHCFLYNFYCHCIVSDLSAFYGRGACSFCKITAHSLLGRRYCLRIFRTLPPVFCSVSTSSVIDFTRW